MKGVFCGVTTGRLSTGFWKNARRSGRAEMVQKKYSKNNEIWNGSGCPSTLTVARRAAGPVESGAKVEIYFEVAARRPEIFFAQTAKKMIFSCEIR
jgi:hypothetical protein